MWDTLDLQASVLVPAEQRRWHCQAGAAGGGTPCRHEGFAILATCCACACRAATAVVAMAVAGGASCSGTLCRAWGTPTPPQPLGT